MLHFVFEVQYVSDIRHVGTTSSPAWTTTETWLVCSQTYTQQDFPANRPALICFVSFALKYHAYFKVLITESANRAMEGGTSAAIFWNGACASKANMHAWHDMTWTWHGHDMELMSGPIRLSFCSRMCQGCWRNGIAPQPQMSDQSIRKKNLSFKVRKETETLREGPKGYYQTYVKLNALAMGCSVSRPRIFILMIRKILGSYKSLKWQMRLMTKGRGSQRDHLWRGPQQTSWRSVAKASIERTCLRCVSLLVCSKQTKSHVKTETEVWLASKRPALPGPKSWSKRRFE